MSHSEAWTDAFLDEQRKVGDPLADETMAAIIKNKGKEEAYRFFGLLIRQIEMPVDQLPAEARPFLEATAALPGWAEAEAIDDAQRLFLDHGPKMLFLLYYKSLPLLYCMAKGAKVLTRTSRLSNEDTSLRIFARRIAETGQFLMDVMAPGGLHRQAQGIQSIQKVRLIHASIRYFVTEEGWDTEELGVPVNQEDMAMTLMTFSVAITDGLRQFGIEEPAALQEAYFRTWRAIGHNLGIIDELLPDKLSDGRQLMEKILSRQAAPSEDGQLLTQALTQFARSLLKSEKLAPAPESIIRFLLGPQYAGMLGIAPATSCLSNLLPHALRSLFRLGERFEDKVDGPLSEVLEFLSRQTVVAMVGYFDQYKGRQFQIPASMEKAWL